MGYRSKECACGCGRVGRFAQYATNACKQRAYRNRKKVFDDIKIQTVSSFLTDLFSEEDLVSVFEHLNEVRGKENVRHVTEALEQLSYLVQSQIRKASRKGRVVS